MGKIEPFDIIVMDPPWKFSSNSKTNPGRNAMRHYDCMTDAEIAKLPVPLWAKRDSLLFMWTTVPMLRRSILIPEAWGFKYVSGLDWPKNRIGTGFWVRNRHEHCLIYKRGTGAPRPVKLNPDGTPKLDQRGRPIRVAPFHDSIIAGDQREHSRKPDSLQDRIDEVWASERKLEVFARQRRLGWSAWGNQIDKFEGPMDADAA